MRLIDVDALRDALGITGTKESCKGCKYNERFEFACNTDAAPSFEYVCEVIDDAPTIEENKTGHWIIKDNPGTGWYRITCSECGEDVTSTAPCIGFFPNAKVTWDYCPNCGARMEGAAHEN